MELEDKMEQARKVLAGLAVTLKAGESEMEEEISRLDQYLMQIEKATQVALNDIDQNYHNPASQENSVDGIVS
nr:hypothetical protein BaRGS_010601 [Batillaria attramentaria]